MSLNAIINSSLTGLFTNQAALRSVSNNIANVNTPDYARLRVEQAALTLQGGTAGVEISGIERVVDEFLNTAQRTSISNTEEFTVQREFHDRLQGILGRPDSEGSLTARLDEAFNAIASLSLSPADPLQRQQAISELNDFLTNIDRLHEEIQSLRSEVSRQIVEVAEDASDQLRQIYELNPLLVRQNVLENDAGAVEGQLDNALSQLSEIIDIQVERFPSGNVAVRTSSGLPLVDSSLNELRFSSPGIVTARTVFPAIELQQVDPNDGSDIGTATDMSSAIRSGRLQGLIELRDGQLADLSTALGELGARARDEFNRIHNAFSAAPPPNSLSGTPTLVDGGHQTNFTGVVNFSVADSSNQVVATTQIDFDGAPPVDFNALVAQVNAGLAGTATLSLTAGVMTLTATDPSHGVVIHDDQTTPSSRAGRGFSHFFGMNDLVTSDANGVYETGIDGTEAHNLGPGSVTFRVSDANNRELAQVTVPPTGATFAAMVAELNNAAGLGAYFTFSLDANGKITKTVNPPRQDLGLQVLSDSTTVGTTGQTFSSLFGLGDSFQALAGRDIRVREAIVADPDQLALSQYDDTAMVGQVALSDGDQRGALALQAIETSLVNFEEAGELRSGALTLSQYSAQWLGNAGLMARRSTNLEEDNRALQLEINQRRTDVSGVNMDEELSNLIVFQNAYQAAARVLSSVQELYDDLLSLV